MSWRQIEEFLLVFFILRTVALEFISAFFFASVADDSRGSSFSISSELRHFPSARCAEFSCSCCSWRSSRCC